MKLTFYSLILLAFFSCGKQNSKEIIKRENEPDVHVLYNDDKEMDIAIDNARKTLYKFKEAILSENPKFYNFALKQRFKVGESDGEHIWISEIEYIDEKFYGIVDDKPISTKEVKFGDTIQVSNSEITDWLYVDNDSVRGAYTTKVLLKRMSEKERNEMEKESNLKY